jgi:hypothetical protein
VETPFITRSVLLEGYIWGPLSGFPLGCVYSGGLWEVPSFMGGIMEFMNERERTTSRQGCSAWSVGVSE